jgi:hypothetical protein
VRLVTLALSGATAVRFLFARPWRIVVLVGLMPEVSDAGKDHRHLALIGGGNDFGIAD